MPVNFVAKIPGNTRLSKSSDIVKILAASCKSVTIRFQNRKAKLQRQHTVHTRYEMAIPADWASPASWFDIE